jgi:hypothetical protein
MKLREYLLELDLVKDKWTVVPFIDLDKEMRHRLWDMYVETYHSIGLHIEDASKLTNKYKIAWLIDLDKDPLPDAFIIYKETKHGNKIALMGSDGDKKSKRSLIKKIVSLLKTKGWYCEASHKVADILKSNNVTIITDIDKIKKVLEKPDVIPTETEGVYKRKLGNLGIFKKQLFGKI